MKKLTLDAFLALAKKIRPEYDYSLVTEYKNNKTEGFAVTFSVLFSCIINGTILEI